MIVLLMMQLLLLMVALLFATDFSCFIDYQVGLPNVGKSTLFNTLTKLSIPAENFPFCTIEPNEARVNIPDERFDWLLQLYKPKSEVRGHMFLLPLVHVIDVISDVGFYLIVVTVSMLICDIGWNTAWTHCRVGLKTCGVLNSFCKY